MKPVDQLSEDEFARLVERAAALPDAPLALIRSAIDQWPGPQPARLQTIASSIVNRLSAALTFDSWAMGAVALGVRAVPSDIRHLLFTADGRDIDIRIAPAGGDFTLSGQILGPDESGSVELERPAGAEGASASPRVGMLDPMGEFRMEGVNPGTYVLTVRVGDDAIVLPLIDVGGHRS